MRNLVLSFFELRSPSIIQNKMAELTCDRGLYEQSGGALLN